ncbi:uncharacterized protein LOC142239129 [Haematobia irritans]|uniref:uncharacterized protein LOC142239129 n=1 Tax=Haematobia irritans TaxID=7368 RepID=UPI003F501FC1
MTVVKKLCIIFCLIAVAYCEQEWTYELERINSSSSNPKIGEAHMEVERISRGKYAFSGEFLTYKEFDDTTFVDLEMFYSSTGQPKDYQRTPFTEKNRPLSYFMNNYYKEFIMDHLNQCSENVPIFEKFEAPMEKLSIKMKKCDLPTDGFPSKMKGGKYKILFVMRNFEVKIETEIIVEIMERE